MSHLILLDGSNWLHRAFHVAPDLTTRAGKPVGAVHGFAWMVFNLIRHPRLMGFTHMAVTFDVSRENWRHAIDPGYKGARGPMRPELAEQFSHARRCIEAFGIAVVETPGFEADDAIATYCAKFRPVLDSDPSARVTIVSSDKDLLQLVSDRVTMLDTLKKPSLWISVDEVIEKFGVPPCHVPGILAIAGDASDHIVGLRGIGVVKAASLLKRHGTVWKVIESLPSAQADTVKRNLRLVTLRTDAPVPSLDEIVSRNVDMDKVETFLDELEFRSLKQHVAKLWGVPKEVYA